MKPARLVETRARKSSAVYSVNDFTKKMPAFATTASIEPNFLSRVLQLSAPSQIGLCRRRSRRGDRTLKAPSISSPSARFLQHRSRVRETLGRRQRRYL